MTTKATDDNPPAFPRSYVADGHNGMNLRDYFATAIDKDEYGDLLYRNASRVLMEALAGPAPQAPSNGGKNVSLDDVAAHQLAKLDWELRFRAAIRYRLADAMLLARKGGA
jgi:hypothetical protein